MRHSSPPRVALLSKLFAPLALAASVGSCNPEDAGPLPEAILCEHDSDCSDDGHYCNVGSPGTELEFAL